MERPEAAELVVMAAATEWVAACQAVEATERVAATQEAVVARTAAEAGLMESARWLCFQRRPLKAKTGFPPDDSSKRRRPKVGGPSAAPKIHESTPDV